VDLKLKKIPAKSKGWTKHGLRFVVLTEASLRFEFSEMGRRVNY